MSHLEQLKAKISENSYLSLLTKLTEAPSVSFVSDPGWHIFQKCGSSAAVNQKVMS
jgi:hypothetical protein